MKVTNLQWRLGLSGLLTTLAVATVSAGPRVEQSSGYVRHDPIPVNHLHHGHPWHHGDHRPRLNLSIGPIYRPWIYPPYYYDPFFYRPRWNNRPVIIEQPAPQIYIEQPQVLSQSAPTRQLEVSNYWYFCESAQAYFPYVNECAGGWQRVVPQPPPPLR